MTELALREAVSRITAVQALISNKLRVWSSGEYVGCKGTFFFLPEHSLMPGLRLVCRFEHVFSAPPHHVPVVDSRHG